MKLTFLTKERPKRFITNFQYYNTKKSIWEFSGSKSAKIKKKKWRFFWIFWGNFFFNDLLTSCEDPHAIINQVPRPKPPLIHVPGPLPHIVQGHTTLCPFPTHVARPQIGPKNKIWSKIYPKK